ncbi:hypothetical protein GALMADRAFT_239947 [Galerina marginata CBS 339.88]|uniref:Uncharacterized protein n=1 Tax=Galerina marginata (strain CBS 339.88) TaxID=685588 RepID=A0A067THC6_GALM3|nr:hypothetical protein GALMADRAFT_239947 [Galerina marginata CBS 339.88]
MATASCPANYDWARNAQGLDPCAVASQLREMCNAPGAVLPAILDYEAYQPPTVEDDCDCSFPVYALVSACADCQSGKISSWDDWSAKCNHRYFSGFPKPLPAGFSIPQWATVLKPKFDPNIAQAIAQQGEPPSAPDATPQPPIVLPSPSSEALLSTSPTTTPNAAPDISSGQVTKSLSETTTLPSIIGAGYSSDTVQGNTATGMAGGSPSAAIADQTSSPQSGIKSNSNRGAVIGGATVGLILFIALVGLLAWWIARRRRSRMAPSAAYMAQYGTSRPPTSMSARPLGDRSNSLLEATSHGRSDSNGPYHDEELRESVYSIGRREPRYTHLPRSSSPMATS